GIRDFHVTGVQTCALPICLREEMLVDVEAYNTRAALRQLDAVEPRVAADVERAPAGHVARQVRLELPPLERREIAQRMLGRGLRSEERRVGKECSARRSSC